jgi:hypothetical protein
VLYPLSYGDVRALYRDSKERDRTCLAPMARWCGLPTEATLRIGRSFALILFGGDDPAFWRPLARAQGAGILSGTCRVTHAATPRTTAHNTSHAHS